MYLDENSLVDMSYIGICVQQASDSASESPTHGQQLRKRPHQEVLPGTTSSSDKASTGCFCFFQSCLRRQGGQRPFSPHATSSPRKNGEHRGTFWRRAGRRLCRFFAPERLLLTLRFCICILLFAFDLSFSSSSQRILAVMKSSHQSKLGV